MAPTYVTAACCPVTAHPPFVPRGEKSLSVLICQTYSGMLAQNELYDAGYESAFTSEARVYQDGLQNTDGLEDRTFCVRLAAKPSYWGKDRTYPWGVVQDKGWNVGGLSQAPPFLMIFRARSRVSTLWSLVVERR